MVQLESEKERRVADTGLWCLAPALFVMVVGIAVLTFGWGLGIDAFKSLRPNYAAMVPTTAFSFLLLSGAIILYRARTIERRIVSAYLYASAVAISAIAVADLVVIFSGTANGIDALLWPKAHYFARSSMAPATAVCFLVSAGCLVLLPIRGGERDFAFVTLATGGLILALIPTIGYLFDADALYQISIFTAMALHTAIAFVAAFLSLLFLRPRAGWIGILLGEGSGSAGARRLIPIIVVAPILLCLAALAITDAGLFDANFRLSALAIIMITLLVATVLRNAVIENTVETRLLSTMSQLKTAVADRDLLLRELHHRVKNNLQQITALINIQSNSITDPPAKTAFRSMSARISALSKAHNLLISSSSPSEVSSLEFIRELIQNLSDSFGATEREISFVVEGDEDRVDIDMAISLGLLIHELLTNALKHAFTGRDRGTITVRYTTMADGGAELIVSDDGRGLAGDVLTEPSARGAGSRIIRGLVRQLNAAMSIQSQNGTCVKVVIPGDEEKRQ